MLKLEIRKHSGEVQELDLLEPRYTLGRAGENDIVLEGSGVSRHHCILRREGAVYVIEDSNSHNGTLVNGRKVRQEILKHGDRIAIGPHLLMYKEGDADIPAPAPTALAGFEEDYDRLVNQAITISSGEPRAGIETGTKSRLVKERHILGLLLELSSALSRLHSVEDVSRKALEILLEATQAERGAIFLINEATGVLEPAMICPNEPGIDAAQSVVLSSTIANRILTERKAIVTADAVADDRFAHGMSVVASGLRSVACSPLLGQAGNLGILYLENRRAVGAFEHEDLEILCAVAGQIGLSIENARFFDTIKRRNVDLERLVEERTAGLRQAQLKLFQTEKMVSLSRLVAGVAHEINNPLGALKSNLELLMVMFGRAATSSGRSKEETALFEHLVRLGQSSVSACARIVSVVRALSSFARLDEAEFKLANINEGLKAVVQLLDPSIRRDAEIVLNLGDIPAIPCYPALLNQAFMNLLINACQAIKKTGQVTVETQRDGDYAVISIRDSGCGIPRERLEKIFDPGFTTKGVGVGTGLGLAVVFTVIREHRGTIQVVSEVDQGSVFTVRLPLQLPPAGNERTSINH